MYGAQNRFRPPILPTALRDKRRLLNHKRTYKPSKIQIFKSYQIKNLEKNAKFLESYESRNAVHFFLSKCEIDSEENNIYLRVFFLHPHTFR